VARPAEIVAAPAPGQGNAATHRGSARDARHALDRFEHLFDVRIPALHNLFKLASPDAKVDVQHEHVAVVESRLYPRQPREAADEQAGADQQDHGERHLRDDERAPDPLHAAACHRPPAVFQRT
jgi:hypothetical protein